MKKKKLLLGILLAAGVISLASCAKKPKAPVDTETGGIVIPTETGVKPTETGVKPTETGVKPTETGVKQKKSLR